jgi:hypothetical protein
MNVAGRFSPGIHQMIRVLWSSFVTSDMLVTLPPRRTCGPTGGRSEPALSPYFLLAVNTPFGCRNVAAVTLPPSSSNRMRMKDASFRLNSPFSSGFR